VTAFTADGQTIRTTQYHAYLLPPERHRIEVPKPNRQGYKMPDPRTGRIVTFPRATTIAGALDDSYGLNGWKMRNVLIGAVLRPEKVAELSKADDITTAPANYLDGYAEAFQVAAGGAEAREFGTAVHAWLEAVDMGHVLPAQVPDMFRAHVTAYLTGLNRNCLVPRRSMSERIVFNEHANCIGTLDRVYSLPDVTDALGDVKTSKTLDYEYLKAGIQLAIYAGASWMWDAGANRWVPMPPLRQDFAVLIHCPSNNPDSTTAVTFDLEACRAALDSALEVRAMRSQAKAHVPNKHALPTPTDQFRRKHDAMTAVQLAASVDDLAVAWEEYQDVWNTHLDQLSATVADRLAN
jgi:hypothetical protein